MGKIDELNYRETLELEMLLWNDLKIDPFSLEGQMSYNDFFEYVKVLLSRKEEDAKNKDGNKTLKMLAMVRDMLNNMKLPEY